MIAAREIIIVDDGQFAWPALRKAVEREGATEQDVRAMDADDYSGWSSRVGMAVDLEPGTTECIEWCDEQIEAGATVWRVA